MTTASTQLRALEIEINSLESVPTGIRNLLTIAKELEKERGNLSSTKLMNEGQIQYLRDENAGLKADVNIRNSMIDDREREIDALEESNATLKRRLDEAKRAVATEPELPGDMPDEMWDAIKGDRDAMNEALKLTVRLTKQNILHRITEIDKL